MATVTSTAALPPQLQVLQLAQPAPATANDAFVESLTRALLGAAAVQQIGGGDGMRTVASCALAAAATAIANEAMRRIVALPGFVLSHTVSMFLVRPAAANSTRHALLDGVSTSSAARTLAWDAKPSGLLRIVRYVLRLLRLLRLRLQNPLLLPLVHVMHRCIDVLAWAERRMNAVGHKSSALHLSVPEKCTDDSYGAKPNIVFADLVWYATTHHPSGATVDGLEVVQEEASRSTELRPGMLSDDVLREYDHGGHRIMLLLTTDEKTSPYGLKTKSRAVKLSAAMQDLSAATHAPIQSFIAHVKAQRAAAQLDIMWKSTMHTWADGAWKERHMHIQKRFDHVAMRATDKAALRADLDAFLAGEAVYTRMGLCWNRGYLLHGPPGCGKSSCISAIACTYHMPIYSVNLREVATDVQLRAMFASMPSGVLAVLEDVDCMTDSVLSRATPGACAPPHNAGANANAGVSLSGLLNVLDGIGASSGRVLVMTTNHKDALDPALVRPGRCDVHLEVGYCAFEQVAFLTRLYLGDAVAAALDGAALEARLANAKVTPAEVTCILLPLATTKLDDTVVIDAEALSAGLTRQIIELCGRRGTETQEIVPFDGSDSGSCSGISSCSGSGRSLNSVSTPATPSG